MPDGKPTKRRRMYHQKRLQIYVPAAMKRDVLRVALVERLPISRFLCGIIRLGLSRYFELLDARKAEPLRQKMRDVFSEDAPFPEMPPFVRSWYEAASR